MALDLTALSATHARKEYNVQRGELRYGATEPRDAAACRCDPPASISIATTARSGVGSAAATRSRPSGDCL